MATKTITTCDRCFCEIKNVRQSFEWRGADLDLCPVCHDKAKELFDPIAKFFQSVKFVNKDPVPRLTSFSLRSPLDEWQILDPGSETSRPIKISQ
jgi:hypothetical protein